MGRRCNDNPMGDYRDLLDMVETTTEQAIIQGIFWRLRQQVSCQRKDAEEWTQMAQDCTGGVTTAGALRSKQTANTNAWRQLRRTKCSGANTTSSLELSMTMHQHVFHRVGYKSTRKHLERNVELCTPNIFFCSQPVIRCFVSLVILTCTLNVCALCSMLSGSVT